jgi:hypothetical protein
MDLAADLAHLAGQIFLDDLPPYGAALTILVWTFCQAGKLRPSSANQVGES